MLPAANNSPSPPLILLAGPTATGKTALAVQIALRLRAEIISADSMQVFKGCAVGTAQPSERELRGIPYHLVACVEPDQAWSVADWLRAARKKMAEIHAKGRAVVVAGGTGLYFKALTEGLFEIQGAERNEELRKELEGLWDADGGLALGKELREADPEAAARIHPNDRLRVVRALEVYRATGQAMSHHQAIARRRHRPPPAHRFVLTAPRSDLYARIDQRVLEMVQVGFVEEVEGLLARGANESWPAMRALGYPQMLAKARGEISLDRAIEETQRQSRRYAKQQLVLFRNWQGAVWLDGALGVEKNTRCLEIILEFCPHG